jgi:hypothetical protein
MIFLLHFLMPEIPPERKDSPPKYGREIALISNLLCAAICTALFSPKSQFEMLI